MLHGPYNVKVHEMLFMFILRLIVFLINNYAISNCTYVCKVLSNDALVTMNSLGSCSDLHNHNMQIYP